MDCGRSCEVLSALGGEGFVKVTVVRSRLAEGSIFADGGLRRQGEPFGQRTRASTFVFFAGDEMAFLVEMIVDLGMN
jgi:hypothetical protein